MEGLTERIAAVHAGRRWILATDAAAAAAPFVEQLREWRVAGAMVVAAFEGVGDLPAADASFFTRTAGATVMGNIRSFLAAIEDPSSELLAAVDEFDPAGEAMVLGSGFSRRNRLCGRPVYGARPATWGALEDKTIADELWDAAGVPRAPSEVVPVAEAPAAARRLAGELGTVWVADNAEGWHGGGEYVRWVRRPEDRAAAMAFFTAHAAEVRVMPFLDGIPCSIHGFVTADDVAVFLPVEMNILRRTDPPGFLYGQAANFWEPPAQVVDAMRAAARRVGAELRRRVGYRGAFGIDGICTAEGFRPTELNPRPTVGHALQARAAELPFGSIERLHLAGDLEVDARWLERAIVEAVRARRGGGAMIPLAASHDEAATGVRFTLEGAVAVSEDAEGAEGTMRIGPAPFGSVLILRLDPDRTPRGPSTAPKVVQSIDLARRLWDVDVPDVEPAPDPFR